MTPEELARSAGLPMTTSHPQVERRLVYLALESPDVMSRRLERQSLSGVSIETPLCWGRTGRTVSEVALPEAPSGRDLVMS